ncbi:hypothetical protein EMCRGX_G027021 [Ephydatia muelleri]
MKWGDANPCKKRECGHPEWLDFPHQGSVVTQSGWTSHTRGVWSPRVAGLPTPGSSQTDEARQLLRYQYLLKFDKAMQKLDDGHSFMKSHLWSHPPIEVILRLIHMWSVKTTISTAVDLYTFVRDIGVEYFLAHPAVIGRPGVEVEIDESRFGK